MSTRTITIDECIHSIIKDEAFNNFTVLHLRDAYSDKLGIEVNLVEARKYVYRQVLRFVRLGLLSKKEGKNKRNTKYLKTSLFLETNFKTRSLGRLPKKDIPSSGQNIDGLEDIKHQLKQYKVDLLACLGESEEYMRLYNRNPQLKAVLESEYHRSRDSSSKLLGQIKALNTVLTHFSS